MLGYAQLLNVRWPIFVTNLSFVVPHIANQTIIKSKEGEKPKKACTILWGSMCEERERREVNKHPRMCTQDLLLSTIA